MPSYHSGRAGRFVSPSQDADPSVVIKLDAAAGYEEQANLWQQGLLCDVLLAPGGTTVGKRIAAHRFAIAAASGYFRALLTGAGACMRPLMRSQVQMCSSPPSLIHVAADVDVVELPDIDSDTLHTVLKAIYERCVTLTPENLEAVLATSSYLEIPCLVEACCQYMRAALDLHNAVPLLTLASQYGCLALRSELGCRVTAPEQEPNGLDNNAALPVASRAHSLAFIGSRFSCLLRADAGATMAAAPPSAQSAHPVLMQPLQRDGSAFSPATGRPGDSVQNTSSPKAHAASSTCGGARGMSSGGTTAQGISNSTQPQLPWPSQSSSPSGQLPASCHLQLPKQLLNTSSLSHLPKDVLLELLSSDDLAVECEADALHAVVDWVAMDPASRMSDLHELVAAVRTDLLPSGTQPPCSTQAHMAILQHVQDILACQQVCSNVLPGAAAGRDGSDNSSPCGTSGRGVAGGGSSTCVMGALRAAGRPRRFYASTLLAAGGHDDSWRGLRSVEVYDPHADCWSLGPQLCSGVSFAACTSLRREVFLFGGTPMCPYASRLAHGHGHAWEHCPALPTPRAHSGVTACAGLLFVLGGRSQEQQVQVLLDRADVLDPGAGAWSRLPHLHTPRSALAAASLGGAVYAIGGQATRGTQRGVEWLDLGGAGRWALLGSSMTTERKYTAAGVLGGRLIVVGGVNAARQRLASVEALDPREGRWHVLAPMQLPRSSCGAAVLHDKLYVVGGNKDDVCVLASVECYDSAAGKWLSCAPLGCARSGLGLCAV